jgi:hypothetical protein
MSLPTSREFVTRLFNSLLAAPQSSADDATTNIGALNPLNSASEATKKQLLAIHVLFPNEFLPALDLLDRHLVTRFRIRDNLDDDAREPEPHAGKATEFNSATEATGQGQLADNEVETRRENEDVKIAQRGEPPTHDPTTSRTDGPVDISDVEMLDAVPLKSEIDELPSVSRSNKEEMGSTQRQILDVQEEKREKNDIVYYVRSAQQRSSRFSTSYDSTTSYEVRLSAWNCSCPAFAFAAFPSAIPTSTVPGPSSISHSEVEERIVGHVEQDTIEGRHDAEEWTFGGVSLGTTTPVCKHLLACVLVERVGMFANHVEEEDVSWEEAAGWAAGWGD